LRGLLPARGRTPPAALLTREASAPSERRLRLAWETARPTAATVLGLQHAVGNRATRSWLQRQAADATIPEPLQQTFIDERAQRVELEGLTDRELQARHDAIIDQLLDATESSAANEARKREAGAIGAILAERSGRTFGPGAIARMRAYFEANAKKPKPDSCIETMNTGIRLLLDEPKQKLGSTVDRTAAALEKSGHAGPSREIGFADKRGKPTTGVVSPVSLQESVWDALIEMTEGDHGWSVFTMGLMDGYHSVTITLDTSDPRQPTAYWSDQWGEKGGFEEYDKAGLDSEVERLTHAWWEAEAAGAGEVAQKKGHPMKLRTVLRLHRVLGGRRPVVAPMK
jgi:hypothetical protein